MKAMCWAILALVSASLCGDITKDFPIEMDTDKKSISDLKAIWS